MTTPTEKKLLKGAFKKWEKEIGADSWSVWDSIETEQLELLLLRGYQLAKKENQEKIDNELRGLYFLVKKGHDKRIQAQIDILERLKEAKSK